MAARFMDLTGHPRRDRGRQRCLIHSHFVASGLQSVSFGQILDEFVPPSSRNKFLINLGANDGARHDPSFPLFVERGYGGILVEGDPAFKKRLYNNMRPFNASGKVQISWGFASASAIGPRLLALGCPREPDALKIDVDGLDAALLEGILQAGITPKSIVIEVNPDIPPPVQMSQLYHDAFTFEFERKHMRGWLGASSRPALHNARSCRLCAGRHRARHARAHGLQ